MLLGNHVAMLDPRTAVNYGVITYKTLAQQFEMSASQSVFLVRMLNDTLVCEVHWQVNVLSPAHY